MFSFRSRIPAALFAAALATVGSVGSQAHAEPSASPESIVVAEVQTKAGFDMRQAQWNLATIGYLRYDETTGVKGARTTDAIKQFQANRCLRADGVAGDATIGELREFVRLIQSRITGVTQDGLGGPSTKKGIQDYQNYHGIRADGVAGENTLRLMNLSVYKDCHGPGGQWVKKVISSSMVAE